MFYSKTLLGSSWTRVAVMRLHHGADLANCFGW